jgi:tRNA A-37 threonylcarbamoyl transferase component Bud32
VVAAVLFFSFLLILVYTILRRRVFGISLIIRQGLRYALARRLLVSVPPALAVLLIVDLWMHREQPLAHVIRARGWMYIAIGVLDLFAKSRRQHWLDALDRRFFRERYDARRLLREIVEAIQRAGSLEHVAPRVVAQIETALHPEFVALLVRRPHEPNYRTMAAAPSGQAPPPFSRDSKLMALMRVLGKPLEISLSHSGWLKEQLPHEDTLFLREARIDLLVPIATDPAREEAILALGAKRSEEPYSAEDRDLLVAIATSLALLLDRPSETPLPSAESFTECPQCGDCYDAGAPRCQRDGSVLLAISRPRLLVARYWLERRIGRGGMGTVYEAKDTALERRVAAKLIREDLVGHPEIVERFRREALASAALVHPNIVTIHDFGVVGGTQAFLVMELLDGVSLRDRLRKEGRFQPEHALQILRAVCSAIEAAHAHQLIHRDLKPENIFLVRSDHGEIPKVVDFGLAKFIRGVVVSQSASTHFTATTDPGALVGTVRYMPPEQFRGHAPQPGWDLWALAITAYEMLTGAYPFPAATHADWYEAVSAGRVTPPDEHLPSAPPGWRDFFNRALSADLERRPKSAAEFLSWLESSI